MKNRYVSRPDRLIALGLACVGAGVGVVTVPAAAQAPAAQPAVVDAAPRQAEPQKMVMLAPMKVGEATHKLLDMQARGVMASDRQYPMPVAVAERIYERYLASFEHPIAEKSGSALDDLKQ